MADRRGEEGEKDARKERRPMAECRKKGAGAGGGGGGGMRRKGRNENERTKE
jgi:hypothetical protein